MNFTRNGVSLIERQPVPNPMAEGRFFHNMTELLWSDGSTTFGCLICGEQTNSRPRMSIHVGKAHNKVVVKAVKPKRKRIYTKRNYSYWNKGGNIEATRSNTNTLAEKELEFWKTQAHKAEAEVRKLRQQIKALLSIQ
jgi:uncharacterized C2H2 Zn-finger protein